VRAVKTGSGIHPTELVTAGASESARKSEHVVTPFPLAKGYPEVTNIQVDVPKSAIGGWLELGIVVVLVLALIVSALLFLAAAAGII